MSAPEGTYSSLLKGPAAQSVARLRAYKPAVDQSFFPRAVGDSRAAVLVALTVATTYSDPNAELQVLLTVRSSKLNTFPSEVALPGGKADGDENPVENAVREGFEEVGIEGKKMEVLSPSGWMCGHVSRNVGTTSKEARMAFERSER